MPWAENEVYTLDDKTEITGMQEEETRQKRRRRRNEIDEYYELTTEAEPVGELPLRSVASETVKREPEAEGKEDKGR